MRVSRFMLAAAVLVGVSPEAFATTQDINLTALVRSYCLISSSVNPTAVSQDIAVDKGFVDGTALTLSFPVTCNTPAKLTLSATNYGLTSGAAAVTGFDNKINYTAATSGIFPALSYSTDTFDPIHPPAALESTSSTPAAGTLTVSITPKVNTQPLTQGSYSDTIRITIVPTV